MHDFVEWALVAFMATASLALLGLVCIVGGMAYLSFDCYRSGDPDSMACYVTNGKTSRIKADVSVK